MEEDKKKISRLKEEINEKERRYEMSEEPRKYEQ